MGEKRGFHPPRLQNRAHLGNGRSVPRLPLVHDPLVTDYSCR
jgi:hypothetical protein